VDSHITLLGGGSCMCWVCRPILLMGTKIRPCAGIYCIHCHTFRIILISNLFQLPRLHMILDRGQNDHPVYDTQFMLIIDHSCQAV
jgi:hypothetical protein